MIYAGAMLPRAYRVLERLLEALAMLRESLSELGWPAQEADGILRGMQRRFTPTAYLFCCLHCGVDLANWEID